MALRRQGSADAWTWLEVPAARRADRLLAIAVDDLGLSRPAIPSLIFGLGEDGGLLLREPLSFGLEVFQNQEIAVSRRGQPAGATGQQ